MPFTPCCSDGLFGQQKHGHSKQGIQYTIVAISGLEAVPSHVSVRSGDIFSWFSWRTGLTICSDTPWILPRGHHIVLRITLLMFKEAQSGQSSHPCTTRMKEHQNAIRRQAEHNHVALHCLTTGLTLLKRLIIAIPCQSRHRNVIRKVGNSWLQLQVTLPIYHLCFADPRRSRNWTLG